MAATYFTRSAAAQAQQRTQCVPACSYSCDSEEMGSSPVSFTSVLERAASTANSAEVFAGDKQRKRAFPADCSEQACLSQAKRRSSSGEAGPTGSPPSALVILRTQLQRYSVALHRLQPKCVVSALLGEYTLAIYRAYVQAFHEQVNNGQRQQGQAPTWEALAATCLWIAIKADGSRACLPSRALLSRAVCIKPEALSAIELDVLIALDWEVFGVLRRSGFHATVRPIEEGPEMQ